MILEPDFSYKISDKLEGDIKFCAEYTAYFRMVDFCRTGVADNGATYVSINMPDGDRRYVAMYFLRKWITNPIAYTRKWIVSLKNDQPLIVESDDSYKNGFGELYGDNFNTLLQRLYSNLYPDRFWSSFYLLMNNYFFDHMAAAVLTFVNNNDIEENINDTYSTLEDELSYIRKPEIMRDLLIKEIHYDTRTRLLR